MAYKEKTIKCNAKNHGTPRDTRSIKNIVVHYTGNAYGDTAVSNANYFKNTALKSPASANDFVDDSMVVHSVPHTVVAYHCGGGLQDQGSTYKSKGAKQQGKVTNTNSIGIELCDCIKDKKNNLSKATRDNATTYIAKIIKIYNIDPDHIYRHFDITGKLCPLYFVTDADDWTAFKKEIWKKYLKLTKKIDKTSGTYLIKRLQTKLNTVDVPLPKLKVDGDYGNATTQYVLAAWKCWGWNKDGKSTGKSAGKKTLVKLKLL